MMHSELTVIEFREELADRLVRMWRASFEAGVGVRDPHSLEEQHAYLLTVVVPNNTVRVVLQAEEVVGFIAATEEMIAQLYVAVAHRGRGIGSMLVEWAKEHSGGTLRLFTFARNAGARAFYERHGFAIVARGFEPEWKLDDLTYEWTRGAAG